MDADLLARAALPWLATWLAHSTVLLLGVWGITRIAHRLAPATQVALWRAALFGPLLTATLPFVLEVPSASARIALSPAPMAAATLPAPVASALESAPLVLPPLPAAEPEVPLAEAFVPSVPTPSHASATRLPLGTWLVLAWAGLAVLLILRSAYRARRVRRRLAGRVPVEDAALTRMVAGMAGRARLRRTPAVTVSEAVASPVAWGVLRPEICVPARALDGLTPEQQEAMLAHELGHIVRRDALWLALGRWLASLFFFQPLFLLARRRLREGTELACDQLAIAITACPLALAECLAEVAGWVSPASRPIPAPAMASTPSLLARRVERLLEPTAAPHRRSGAALIGALGLLTSVALWGPGFTEGVDGLGTAAASANGAFVAADADARPPTDTPLAAGLRAIDEELALVRASLAELDGLAAALDDHPEVRAAVRRLADRMTTLHERRNALARAALGDDR